MIPWLRTLPSTGQVVQDDPVCIAQEQQTMPTRWPIHGGTPVDCRGRRLCDMCRVVSAMPLRVLWPGPGDRAGCFHESRPEIPDALFLHHAIGRRVSAG